MNENIRFFMDKIQKEGFSKISVGEIFQTKLKYMRCWRLCFCSYKSKIYQVISEEIS